MREIYAKFFRFAGRQKGKWHLAIVLEFLQSMAVAAEFVPLFIVLRDMVGGTLSSSTALAAFAIMAASVAVQAVLHYFSHKLEMQASYLMLDDKRLSIGDRVKYMPMGFFNAHSLGNLTAVCTSVMDDLESMSTAIIVRILTGMIHAVVCSLALAVIDWRVGLVFLAGIVCMLLVNSRMITVSRRYSPDRLAAQMRLVDGVLEYIQGMGVVKSFNLGGSQATSLERTIDETERQNFFLESKSTPYTVAQQCVLRLFGVVAVALSCWLYLAGELELFECLLMLIGGFFVYSQIEQASSLSFMLPMVDASIDRVLEVDDAPRMDERGTVEDAPDTAINVEHATFAYPSSENAPERPVICDVSLSIPARTSCAIVGPSGSGKTTLVNLMARFWDVSSGRVTVGGVDVREWKLDSLMERFSMVFQDVYLFNDTVENNIRFGKPDATHEEVVDAARRARCHEFIEQLPQGYKTMLGEGGATLSGGEKQRISIARALLKDAPVILLDEATASVDPENEQELQTAIEELTAEKTVVMIAHRLTTVRNADQIVVMDEGRIAQRGTHEELMREGGLYRRFVEGRSQAIGWRL